MTKEQAHAILDKIRDGMSVAGATQALERTGDIPQLSGQSLCVDGNEPSDYRPCQAHDQAAEVGFSYSAYLDCPTIERTA